MAAATMLSPEIAPAKALLLVTISEARSQRGPPILPLAGKARWGSAVASKLYLVWPCWGVDSATLTFGCQVCTSKETS
jgi:hypothetical protein